MPTINSLITTTTLLVNGEKREITFRNADILLFVLRNYFGLTGAKPGCLNGDCGACTVQIDGVAQKSCLVLAVETIDKEILTVEGLDGVPIQGAFVEHFAFQCGYCTPGFIMNCQALIESLPKPTDKEITKWLESNICRCTGYLEIEKAIKSIITTES